MPLSDAYNKTDRLYELQMLFWKNPKQRFTTPEIATSLGVSDDTALLCLKDLTTTGRLPLTKEGRFYRDFLSGDDLRPFWQFTTAYSAYLMSAGEKDHYMPPLTTHGLEHLLMDKQEYGLPLTEITGNSGFRRVAYAIRQSTVDDERQVRASLLLESLLHTFIELNGAMRSTQLPHVVALEGMLTTSAGVAPAPLISPLIGGPDDHETYRQQAASIVRALNGDQVPTAALHPFDTIGDFATQMRALIDSSSPLATSIAHS